MQSLFRTTRIMLLLFTVALFVSGCAKHHPAAENVPPPPPLTEEEMRKIVVAKVNGVDLTMDMLVRMTYIIKSNMPPASAPIPEEELRKMALDQVILRELALQDAARRELRAEPRELEDAVESFIQSKGHEAGFQAFLQEQRLTETEVRAQLEKSLILRLIFSTDVVSKVSITDDDVRKEYEQQKDRLKYPEKVTVVDVLIPRGKDDAASMTKANELLAKITADKDRNPRNLTPDSSFTVGDRDLDKTKEPSLYDAARQLKEGELSGVIKADDGIHIVQLTSYVPEKALSFEEAKGYLEQRLTAIAQQKRIKEWEESLKKDAKIETVALSEVKIQEEKVRSQRTEVGSQQSAAGSQQSEDGKN